MPVWSLEELQASASLYPDPKALLAGLPDLYAKWGGIPRYVLQYAGVPTEQANLLGAIREANLQDLTSVIGQKDANKLDISFRLVHYVVNEHFNPTQLVMGSKYIADHVVEVLKAKHLLELKLFLSSSGELPQSPYGGVRGHLFESWSHSTMLQSPRPKLLCRPLVAGVEGDLSLPPAMAAFRFYELPQLTQYKVGQYAIPSFSNLESVDAFVVLADPPRTLLFQMTVSDSHPVKAHGLEKLFDALGHCTLGKVELYFVVPNGRYSDFQAQTYHSAQSKETHPTVLTIVPQRVKAIQQYALLMPVM